MTGDRKLTDRRKTGVHSTRISDGNGSTFSLITVAASRVKVIAGSITAVLLLLGTVYASVRAGVKTEVHDQITYEAQDENGTIHLQMEKCIEAHQKVVEQKFDEDFEKLDLQLREQKEVGVRAEEQLGALDRKVDANQRELLRAIQQAGGGSG